jgi:hypothetical protein
MNRGYVRLWRKSLDAGWLRNHKLWAFWSYCLLKASYREYDAIVGLQIIHLLPGQFIFGLKKASEETGLTIREIRTILDFLKKAGNLTIKTTNKFSIITIVNWHTYQPQENENDTQNDKQVANKGQHTRSIELKKEDMSSADKSAFPSCPHEKIIALFHETCPMLPRVRSWTDKRRGHLQARWKEDLERQDLGWWREFFGYISKSAFLTGKVLSGDRKPFIADLPWIIEPEHFAKIIEGKYE